MFSKIHTKTFTKYFHEKTSYHCIGPTQKDYSLFYFFKASVFPIFSPVKIKYKVIVKLIIRINCNINFL